MAVAPVRRARRQVTEEIVESAKVSVYATHAGEDSERAEVISITKFVTEPAYVRVSAGVTRNMGNYESLRLDVSVSIPCYVEEIERVQAEAADIVAKALEREQDNYTGGSN